MMVAQTWSPWAAVGAGLFGAGSSLFGGGSGWGDRYGKQMAREQRNAVTELDKYWRPFDQQRFATTQPIYQAAFNNLQGLNPSRPIQNSMGILARFANQDPSTFTPDQVSAGQVGVGNINALNPGQINTMTQQFMNPFTQNVIDRTTAGMNRAFDQQRVGNAARAAGLGAFGSSGQALENVRTSEAQGRAVGDMEAQLRSQGFSQAQAAAMARAQAQEAIQGQNVANQFAAGASNRDAALRAALANQGAGLTANQQNMAARNMQLDAARSMMQGGFSMFNPMAQFGAIQQGLAQQPFDFNFNQYQSAMSYPFQRVAALSGAPVGAMMGQGQSQNPFLNALGMGLGFGGQVYDFLNRDRS